MKNWKDIVQYTTAIIAMGSGVVLAFLQYFDSGDITNGVLGYVAQVLLYAASIFGATMYWNGKYNELKSLVVNDKRNTNLVGSSQK